MAKISFARKNKTNDWALVQTAALVINKDVEVRLSQGDLDLHGDEGWPAFCRSKSIKNFKKRY